MAPLTNGLMTASESPAPRAIDFGALLAPIHDRARASARRLGGSAAEGDDLFHEAVLRAMEKLGALREIDRFAPWFYSILISVHRDRTRRSFWRRLFPLDDRVAIDPVGDDGQRWEDERHRARRASQALATL